MADRFETVLRDYNALTEKSATLPPKEFAELATRFIRSVRSAGAEVVEPDERRVLESIAEHRRYRLRCHGFLSGPPVGTAAGSASPGRWRAAARPAAACPRLCRPRRRHRRAGRPPDRRQHGAAITGLRGMGGIGKTQLALAVAQRLRDAYPDQLMFELQPGASPLTPEALLGRVIHAFQPELKLPDALEELQALYRSLLAGRRGLLLLDNAADGAQVRPLLPPPAGWAVIVTSRSRSGSTAANCTKWNCSRWTMRRPCSPACCPTADGSDIAGADLEPSGRILRPAAARAAPGRRLPHQHKSPARNLPAGPRAGPAEVPEGSGGPAKTVRARCWGYR